MEAQHIRDTPPASWMEMSFFFLIRLRGCSSFPFMQMEEKEKKRDGERETPLEGSKSRVENVVSG